MFFLYKIFSLLYPFIINLASPYNRKAMLWIKGRKRVLKKMQKEIDVTAPLIWVHCSSLGEFEQGRPLIEKIRANYSSYKILLTFFSPSGYEFRKDYNGADYIFYLPMDSEKNASAFFNIAKPKLILFIKYEFWYYYLHEAKKRNVPLLLISGIFRKKQLFFSKYGKFHRSLLACFSHFFVQNEESSLLLKQIGLAEKVTISGDTRFDRVIEIAEKFRPIIPIETFCRGSDVIVAGSTWSEDDKILAGYINKRKDIKSIIAPHSINDQRINECQRLYKKAVLFSKIATTKNFSDFNTIIIDNMGMLSRLYKYATVTYVGGGFGKEGVHNVLEAAVYGKPVVFGPIYQKFFEAVELFKAGGGISVKNFKDLEETFDKLFEKEENYQIACKAAAIYVYNKRGATEKILKYIQEKRLLTN